MCKQCIRLKTRDLQFVCILGMYIYLQNTVFQTIDLYLAVSVFFFLILRTPVQNAKIKSQSKTEIIPMVPSCVNINK